MNISTDRKASQCTYSLDVTSGVELEYKLKYLFLSVDFSNSRFSLRESVK